MSGASYGGDEVGAVVVDIGSSSVRVGYAGYDSPVGDFPSVVCTLPTPEHGSEPAAMETSTTTPTHGQPASPNSVQPAPPPQPAVIPQTVIFGSEPMSVPRSKAVVSPLLKDGLIDDWDMFERLMKYIYKRHLNSDSVYHPILMSEASWNTKQKREKMTEIMFEKFNVPAFYLAKSAMLSAFANGRSTALILDSGAAQTAAVPVHDGYVLTQAIQRSPLAGDFINLESKRILQEMGIDVFPTYMVGSKETVGPDQPPRWTKRVGIPEGVTESYHNFQVKEVLKDFGASVLHVSEVPFDRELAETLPTVFYEFPNGFNRHFGAERLRIPEPLMDVSLLQSQIGGGHAPSSALALPQLVLNSISLCDADVGSSLYPNIVVVGGNSLIQGFTDRLNRELLARTGPNIKLRVTSIQSTTDRRFSAWIGGSILASLGTFHQMWITKQEYEETGRSIVDKKCA